VKGPLSGTRAWLMQRLSALYLLVFTLYVLVQLATGVPHSYEEWHAWMAGGGVRVAVLLFFVALLVHAWVGLRDVVIDYVHPLWARLAVLAAIIAGEVAIGLWVALILVPLE